MINQITIESFDEIKEFFSGATESSAPVSSEALKTARKIASEIIYTMTKLASSGIALSEYEKRFEKKPKKFPDATHIVETETEEEVFNNDSNLEAIFYSQVEKALPSFKELTKDDYEVPQNEEVFLRHLFALVLYYTRILPNLENFCLSTHLKIVRSTAKLMLAAGLLLPAINEKGFYKYKKTSQKAAGGPKERKFKDRTIGIYKDRPGEVKNRHKTYSKVFKYITEKLKEELKKEVPKENPGIDGKKLLDLVEKEIPSEKTIERWLKNEGLIPQKLRK